jgi:hypothetical protein
MLVNVLSILDCLPSSQERGLEWHMVKQRWRIQYEASRPARSSRAGDGREAQP